MIPFPILSTSRRNPTPILRKIKKVASTFSNIYVLYEDGRLYGKGLYAGGLAGKASTEWVLCQTDIKNIFTGGNDHCVFAISNLNKITYCGKRSIITGTNTANTYDNWTDMTLVFSAVGVENIKDIRATSNGIYVLLNDNTCYTLGYSTYGEIGVTRTSLTYLASDVRSIFGGSNIGGYVTTSGVLWRGGYNGVGQLGIGNQSQPKTLIALDGVVVKDAISCSGVSTYYIGTDNTVYGAGEATPMNGNVMRTSFTALNGKIDRFLNTAGGFARYFYGTLNNTGLWSAGDNLNYTLGSGTTTAQATIGTPSIGFETVDTTNIQVVPCITNGVFLLYNNNLYFTGSSNLSTEKYNMKNTKFTIVSDLPI